MKKLGKIFLVLWTAFLLSACGPNRHFAVNETQKNTPVPEKTVETAADKLNTVKQQGFQFIYVFRRKDGGKLDAEDKKFLRANSPVETNQWVVTDEGVTAIAASNYMFAPVQLDALKTQFNVEDLSEKTEQKNSETETNSNK